MQPKTGSPPEGLKAWKTYTEEGPAENICLAGAALSMGGLADGDTWLVYLPAVPQGHPESDGEYGAVWNAGLLPQVQAGVVADNLYGP